ncbi:hypothetical protein [Inhella gelatinilytica]|uniref:Uncharacterized protein n=1 Tax=Inhella gelatinilytica TaxID=2795030 RepID=A0A931IZP4_9BURK|nr:hypothetical protein [Inhella gelatinilytica]MBH9553528.1 hypothetical protein [Inhella gelatinilytica]
MATNRRWVLIGGLLGAGATWADRGDDGDYQILSARYGTRERNVDVTERLKELARRDRTFVVGNDAFGVDPVPGQRKVLRIFAVGRGGDRRTFEFLERDALDGHQFTGWRTGQDWGRDRDRHWDRDWNRDGRGWDQFDRPRDDAGQYEILGARYGSTRANMDVTDRLRELARSDRRFRVSNELFGHDPDHGTRKQLRIYARDGQGREQTMDYPEGSYVEGALFLGWSTGNWGRGGRPGRPWERDGDAPRGGGYARVRVLEARYGADQRWSDVTREVQHMLNRGGRPEIHNSWLGGDPAPGVRKTLWVRYERDGRTQEIQFQERDELNLP